MTRETYYRVTGLIRGKPRRVKIVKTVNRILTGFVFLVYPLFLLTLYLEKNPFLPRAVLVPAVSFAGVSIFRNLFRVQRPYERFGLPPVLEKDTSGKSFPSRHVFSVFVIAATVFMRYPGAGIALGMTGVALAAIRVIGGVHTPLDVTAGALIGIAAGMIGYCVL